MPQEMLQRTSRWPRRPTASASAQGGSQQPHIEPAAPKTDGDKPRPDAAATGARADSAVDSAPGSASDAVRNLQGAGGVEPVFKVRGSCVRAWRRVRVARGGGASEGGSCNVIFIWEFSQINQLLSVATLPDGATLVASPPRT